MSIKLLKSPFVNEFRGLLSQAKREIIFSSPYINDAGAAIILNSINDVSNKNIHIITNLSVRNIVDNVTQPSALLKIYDSFKNTTVSSLAKLHAKVYIIDDLFAVISSANLTYGGLKSNFEYGVLIDEKQTIQTVKQDVLDYASLGLVFDKIFLTKIYEESQKIEEVQEKQIIQRTDSDLKLLLEQQQKIDTILIKPYENKETRHGIFAKTTQYLLEKNKELTTEEIYQHIQEIHPEICDDNRKYKNGEKKWKIEVRQARFALQRKGIVKQVPNLSHTWTLLK
ncbi:MAG: phospholipase D-like domain-containing protein [Bacteroidales bacterium]|jgi:phosphatidylserine/phosphatidylglycerophosphate/cardiolipin synthase-like enzyme|nr:phospholipase D-like domain-containing protein [Bacteroidales bacterium]